MKTIKVSLVLSLALACVITRSVAQSPSPSKTTPSPAASAAASPSAAPAHTGDPFVKKPGQSPEASGDGRERNATLYFTVEVYALSQTDAAKLLEENPDGESRHARVLELAVAGKARFETLLSNITKSGQRSVVEEIDEVRYPTSLLPSEVPGQPAWPKEYETRNVGASMEYEPVLSPDKSICDVNVVLNLVRFQGFSEIRARGQDQPVAQPGFETKKFTTSIQLVSGKTAFLGTVSAPPQFAESDAAPAPQEVKLAFGRISPIPQVSGTASGQEQGGTLEQELVFYSMDREAARQILAGDPKPGGYYDAVRALADQQKARLERLTVLKTKSGQRAIVEETDEVRYASEYALYHDDTTAPKSAANLDYQPIAFETRNTGLTLEIEPVAEKSLVDINLVPQLVRNIGPLQANGVAAKYPAVPVFEMNKVTTSLSAALGEHAYIGTFTPPGGIGVNGRKDSGKTWLGFIRTVYARP